MKNKHKYLNTMMDLRKKNKNKDGKFYALLHLKMLIESLLLMVF